MAAKSKTLAAVGIAFAAGIAVNAALKPEQAASPAMARPKPEASRAATVPVAPVASQEPTPGAWSDPVRSATAPTRTLQGTAEKPVFTPEASPPAKGSEIAFAPLPPVRPTTFAAVPEEAVQRKAAETSHTPPRTRSASTRAVPSSPSVEAMRRAEGHRQAMRYVERRRDRDPYESGYRTAGYPARDYAYAYGDAYDDGAAYLARGGWRAESQPRVVVRRYGGSDGLRDWLSEPGRGY